MYRSLPLSYTLKESKELAIIILKAKCNQGLGLDSTGSNGKTIVYKLFSKEIPQKPPLKLRK